MKTVYTLMACCFLLSCREEPLRGGAEGVVARVGENVLLRQQVEEQIPKGVAEVDSLIIAGGIVKRWVKEVLMYEAALKYLGADDHEVVRLVEEYRRSLIRYRYQESLLQERLAMEVSEGDKVAFYEENHKEFPLSGAIVRGVFLKIPVDAPGLQEIRKTYMEESELALERIEKYSMQNAISYEYFYDRWESFEDVMRNIPMQVQDADAFLQKNRSLEVRDERYCYLLHIGEYMPSGSTAPYDFVSDQITSILVNQRKAQFMRNVEDDLYEAAVSRGRVVIYE
ncbi:MAG: peptidyl-prolyl cis-trans isomerase [Tannerellaceae bacterium]|jgi:hypothetical protein|nr:peptidyl-prolyl cis-trans isomerase [Tannerellaceae bacterium]